MRALPNPKTLQEALDVAKIHDSRLVAAIKILSKYVLDIDKRSSK